MKTAPRFRRLLARALLWAWVPSIVVPVSYLMAGHLVALPEPSRDDVVLKAALRGHRRPGDRLVALHVVYSRCSCSNRIVEHLLGRGPRPGVSEALVLVVADGAPAEFAAMQDLARQAAARGFGAELVTAGEAVTRFHVESSPLLVIADNRDVVRYVGGYTDRRRGPEILDASIVDRLERGEAVEPLPVFGCAIAAELQRTLDPLGLRY